MKSRTEDGTALGPGKDWDDSSGANRRQAEHRTMKGRLKGRTGESLQRGGSGCPNSGGCTAANGGGRPRRALFAGPRTEVHPSRPITGQQRKREPMAAPSRQVPAKGRNRRCAVSHRPHGPAVRRHLEGGRRRLVLRLLPAAGLLGQRRRGGSRR